MQTALLSLNKVIKCNSNVNIVHIATIHAIKNVGCKKLPKYDQYSYLTAIVLGVSTNTPYHILFGRHSKINATTDKTVFIQLIIFILLSVIVFSLYNISIFNRKAPIDNYYTGNTLLYRFMSIFCQLHYKKFLTLRSV